MFRNKKKSHHEHELEIGIIIVSMLEKEIEE